MTLMTLIIMIEYDFSGFICVNHNYQHHPRSIVLSSRTCLRLN